MLHDNDIMPFGKHQGKALVNVPAIYFLYLLDNGYLYPNNPDHVKVKAYILANLDVLKKEAGRK